MEILAALAIGAVLVFGFVVFFGPPYLPTRRAQIAAALDLLELKPGQTLLDLGSGDGRVVKAAAKRGLKVVGIELNPLLVLISRLATWRYRNNVRIIWGSYFALKWPPADGIFTFMIGRQMQKLDQKIEAGVKPVRLASFAFKIPGKKLLRQKRGVYLYEYK